ncbi:MULTISPECIES: LuxR C-terminal-related transcriptional regulator [unclassified Microbacterium]|uniref:helix-turn-helix transcriptional regulator n=1 Tax=unclassified Microbacterium TaxID=2609290 RepID=UPI0038648E51
MAVLPRAEDDHVPHGWWSRLVDAHIEDALASSCRTRIVIVGPAGSQTSTLMRHLREEFTRRDGSSDRIRFINDAQLLTDAEIDDLEAHLEQEDAGVVLTCRPWPRSDRLRGLLQQLEQAAPPLVLGQVDARDVVTIAGREGVTLTESCARSITDLCGSVVWLVREAVAAHGDGPCHDAAHDGVARTLADLIAERLAMTDPDVAASVRRASLESAGPGMPSNGAFVSDDDAARAHALGFLHRNGRSIPVIRTAVLRSTPVSEMVSILGDAQGPLAPDVVDSFGAVTDPRLARTLLAYADDAAGRDEVRTAELYDAARNAGADPLDVAVRLARLAWSRGEIDTAAAEIDAAEMPTGHPSHDSAVDLIGAVWSARGFLEVSGATFRAHSLTEPRVRTHAAIATLGTGHADLLEAVTADPLITAAMPTTLSVSRRLMMRGLSASVSSRFDGALDDLVRASEIYTDAQEDGPIPELPAVLATMTAVNAGELDTAHTILTGALMNGHGGGWARPRLLLWAAWVAVQRQQPDDASARMAEVDASPMPLGGRDVLLRDAVLLAYVRRYGAPGELRPLWERVRDDIRVVEPDLFTIHPLAEFLAVSAMFDDTARTDAVLRTTLAMSARLGDPPLWAGHLHWAAFLQAANDPTERSTAAHVKVLLSLAASSNVCAAMAAAASQWILTDLGEIDVARVEEAAERLASVGLSWDAARLASAAADHVDHRRPSALLTTIARRLHPRALGAENRDDLPAPEPAPDPLTAREREVAALVVSGKTYAEIGEAIFISPRTAEHHIARIRRRIGATSRADLITKLRSIVDGDDTGPRWTA